MAEIVVVVSLQAAEGRGDEIAKAFGEAIPPTHAEEGCVKYALHRDRNDPDHFVHIEKWRSQEDLDAHMQTPHLGAVFAALSQPGIMAGGPKMWMLNNELIGEPQKGAL